MSKAADGPTHSRSKLHNAEYLADVTKLVGWQKRCSVSDANGSKSRCDFNINYNLCLPQLTMYDLGTQA